MEFGGDSFRSKNFGLWWWREGMVVCVCVPPFARPHPTFFSCRGHFQAPCPPGSRPPLLGGEGLGGHQRPHGHAAPERKARARGSLQGRVSHGHCSAKEWGMLEERGVLSIFVTFLSRALKMSQELVSGLQIAPGKRQEPGFVQGVPKAPALITP